MAIIGGGYTGLWTAIAMRERDDSTDVAVLEANRCGGQASGKNGGMVHGYWTSLPRLLHAFDIEDVRRIVELGSRAQEAVREFCLPRAEETWWRESGIVKVATTPRQETAMTALHEAARTLGRPDQVVALSASELRERIVSPRFRTGVFLPEGATVHPGRLARALRQAVVESGVDVYEQTKVLEVRPARGGYELVTPQGRLSARRVVFATNAALASHRLARRRLTNFSSFAVMTEPAPAALAEHGWTGGEALLDCRMFLHYFRTTPDGRVLMGTGSGPIGFGSRLHPNLTRDAASIARAVDGLRYLLPAFAEVEIAAAWGGPIDVSSDHLPIFGSFGWDGIFYGGGYSGHGVNASWIGGQTLASLVLGLRDTWTESPFVLRRPPLLPFEPLRYIGGRMIRSAILSCEEAEQDGRDGSPLARFAASLPNLLGMRIGVR